MEIHISDPGFFKQLVHVSSDILLQSESGFRVRARSKLSFFINMLRTGKLAKMSREDGKQSGITNLLNSLNSHCIMCQEITYPSFIKYHVSSSFSEIPLAPASVLLKALHGMFPEHMDWNHLWNDFPLVFIMIFCTPVTMLLITLLLVPDKICHAEQGLLIGWRVRESIPSVRRESEWLCR